jgi:hypothetical protein
MHRLAPPETPRHDRSLVKIEDVQLGQPGTERQDEALRRAPPGIKGLKLI